MNRENIEYCIELMRNAKNLNMTWWQHGRGDDATSVAIHTSIEDLHACGNTACFGGYVALSEKFQADGGFVYDVDGSPVIEIDDQYHYDDDAIAEWLGIDNILAASLVLGDCGNGVSGYISWFYHKPWSDVTPDDVIEKLQAILDGVLT